MPTYRMTPGGADPLSPTRVIVSIVGVMVAIGVGVVLAVRHTSVVSTDAAPRWLPSSSHSS